MLSIMDRPEKEKWIVTKTLYKKMANSLNPNTLSYTFGPNIIDICADGNDPLIKPSELDLSTQFFKYDYNEETEERVEAAKEPLWGAAGYHRLPLDLSTRIFITTTFMGSDQSHRLLNCTLAKFPEVCPIYVDNSFNNDTIHKVNEVVNRHSVAHFRSVWKDETFYFLDILLRADEDWKKYKTSWKSRFTHI